MCLDVLRLGFATARSGEKRWRTTAVQNAGAFTKTPEIREASWSAPALWRFGRSAGEIGRRRERLRGNHGKNGDCPGFVSPFTARMADSMTAYLLALKTHMTYRKTLVLFVVVAIGAPVAGCKQHTASKTVDDKLWVNGELRVVVDTTHYVAPVLSFHGSGTRTRQEWALITIPIPDRPNQATRKREFLRLDGDYDHFFSSIKGSDFLLHQIISNMSTRQLFLFDPKTGKDISQPFPAQPTEWWLANRSRTACMILEGKQVVIRDTLSAATGEPKLLARPPWAGILERLKYGEYSAVLTDDARHLVLFPYTKSGRSVVASNFTSEVWSIDGSVEKFFLPLERKEGNFVDSELIGGKVMLLWRTLLSNGAEDGVELLDVQGESLHAGKISAFTVEHSWDVERGEMLFPYYEGPGWNSDSSRTFYLWNYSSNSVRRITVKR